jgi:hypothetical protein
VSRRSAVPYACIAAAVVLANLPALVHLVTVNPLTIDAGLVPGPLHQILPGYPTIDPNAGFLMQALGHLTVTDWLSGHIPWWNPYEGIGVPLAGDMQSGGFFPPTMLFNFSDGTIYLQVLLELVAGFGTLALLLRLGVGRIIGTGAATAFALCGTFAWFSIEPIRVLAFLPLCLLGIERALESARQGRAWGWRLLALGVACTVLGGFAETILLDLLFVVWWAVLRVIGPGRQVLRPMLTKLMAGAACGAALSAPLWVAFAGYVRFANTGAHTNGGFAFASLEPQRFAQLVLPYSIGPIFGFHSTTMGSDAISGFWDGVGGYLGVTLLAGTVVGLFGRRNRILRIGLGLWVAVSLSRTYGFPPVVHLLAPIPGVRLTAFYRYADPTWELAAAVLTGMGLDDIARQRTRIWALWLGVGIAGGTAIWAAFSGWRTLSDAAGPNGSVQVDRHSFADGSLAFALVLLGLLLIGGWWAGKRVGTGRSAMRRGSIRKRGRILLAGSVALEAMVLLGFTYLSAPRPAPQSTGAVAWLQANLGTYRIATLGPIQPNYGSYYRLAEVNVNELPLPQAWTDYVAQHLDSNIVPFEFTGGYKSNPAGPSPAQELSTLMANYEAVGVRYVVEGASGTDPTGAVYPAPGSAAWPDGPRLVYQDSFAKIWELPNPAPAFSIQRVDNGGTTPQQADAGCHVSVHGWDEAQVTCDHPTTLIRRVQYAPGWSATIGTQSVPVVQDRSGPHDLFQSVVVPSGTNAVRFTYLPPHEVPAIIISALTLVGFVASMFVPWVAMRRRRRQATTTADGEARTVGVIATR